jgi:hypothetical protein
MDEKVLTAKDLQDRFIKLSEEVKKAQDDFSKMQNSLQAKSVNINHIQGAMQDTVDLMVMIIGESAVKIFIDGLNKPQEEKKDGTIN